MLTTIIIGNKIADARKRINISQAQLAERLFISSQAVGKWERGESMPDIITFNRLAEILAVDLNYFSERFQTGFAESSSMVSIVKQSDNMPSGKEKKKLNWDMSRGNWVGADFSGLKNLNEKFSSSNLQQCKFIGSDMSGLLLKFNNVENCDFSGSDFSGSHLQSSNFVNNLFKDCSLKETEFSMSHIKGCDFSGANFTGVIFKYGTYVKNLMANTIWSRTTFNLMHMTDIIFEGTLEDCCLENCVFSKVTFQNAKLINTFFKNKSLKRIRFIDCQADRLTYECLKNGKADLNGIELLKQ